MSHLLRSWSVRTLSGVACGGLLLAAVVQPSPAGASITRPQPDPAVHPIVRSGPQSVPLSSGRRWIAALTAGSTDDVWAVGSTYVDRDFVGLSQHWDGSRWTRIPTPGDSVQLDSVSEVGPDDVWAVGAAGTIGSQRPIIMRWDGASWSVVAGDSRVTGGWLSSVAAISADDVWAIGTGEVGTGHRNVVEHWDGVHWSLARTPALGGPDGEADLAALAFSSASDGWLLGFFCGNGPHGYRCLQRALHWDGSRWVKASMPSPAKSLHYDSIVALSSTDAWAVGATGRWRHAVPISAHWDGHTWTSVPFPSAEDGSLSSVVAVGPDDVWAVGDYSGGSQPARGHRPVGHERLPLVGHFNGSTWTLSDMPTGRADKTYLGDAVAIGTDDVWAGGSTGKAALLSHWDGFSWN
jgi:hypothetical protein